MKRASFLFFYFMSFQEILSDNLFTEIVFSSKTKQPTSNADFLRFSLTLMYHDVPVSFFNYVNVLSVPCRYVPSGILLKSNQNDAVYFDENDADLIQRTDLNSNELLQLDYNVSPIGFLPFVIDDYISIEQ